MKATQISNFAHKCFQYLPGKKYFFKRVLALRSPAIRANKKPEYLMQYYSLCNVTVFKYIFREVAIMVVSKKPFTFELDLY